MKNFLLPCSVFLRDALAGLRKVILMNGKFFPRFGAALNQGEMFLPFRMLHPPAQIQLSGPTITIVDGTTCILVEDLFHEGKITDRRY
ncbi:MAG: hypothetical protein IPH20_20495 [Bacteroidales bacterium]|nr:hypothetical protein [Bacteroidales bacterium]